jgi:hypothetical protein
MRLHSHVNRTNLRIKLLGELIVMQASNASNSGFRVNSLVPFRIMKLDLNSLPRTFALPTAAGHPQHSGVAHAGMALPGGRLPMTKEKRLAEFIETSLICFLGAMAAMFGFLLVWLVGTLAGFGAR